MSELSWWVQQGDSTEILKTLPAASVDALVTDPPAGIGFMGKEWDDFRRQRNPNDAGRDSVMGRLSRSGPEYGRRDRQHFVEWLTNILVECRRVMKPGAYGWVWAIPRTAHWTATACEDAGFAVRDVLTHVFGTGFPKSRALLKPAAEMWVLIKAPGELRELRIEENRIAGVKPVMVRTVVAANAMSGTSTGATCTGETTTEGRWPANFALSHDDECVQVGTRKIKTSDPRRADGTVHGGLGQGTGRYGGNTRLEGIEGHGYGDADGNEVVEAWQCVEGCPVKLLDEQSPVTTSAGGGMKDFSKSAVFQGQTAPNKTKKCGLGDRGTASRFFYVAKPSTRERSEGLPAGARNVHTTVKSVALMRHLVSLIAAPGDLVLDPFAGSGTTGIAALKQGCRFVGVEQSEEYCEIARRRILYYAGTIPAHEPTDAAGVPGHDAPAHHADHGLPEHEQPAAGLPAQRAEGEPPAAGAGGELDAGKQHLTGREAPGTDH